MENRASYKVAVPVGQLAGIVDSTMRRLDDVSQKLIRAQLDPAQLEKCIAEMEEITQQLDDSVREAVNVRRTYA